MFHLINAVFKLAVLFHNVVFYVVVTRNRLHHMLMYSPAAVLIQNRGDGAVYVFQCFNAVIDVAQKLFCLMVGVPYKVLSTVKAMN